MDNYQTIETRLARLEPFKGNSSHAEWITAKDGTRIYRVFSYSTLIAQTLNGSYWVDERKISNTTSRLQNLTRKAWGLN